MKNDPIADKVFDVALRLFNSSLINDELVKSKGKISDPIAIQDFEDGINSWFVGIIVDKSLAGFFQINKDLHLLRYSSFQRKANSVDDCPEADSWLNKTVIAAKAGTKAGVNDKLLTPFLTYDQNPSRIVWCVIARTPSGKEKRIFVAGEYVYMVA